MGIFPNASMARGDGFMMIRCEQPKNKNTCHTSWRPKTSTASGDDLEASLVLIGIVPFFRVCFVIVFFSPEDSSTASCTSGVFSFLLCRWFHMVSHQRKQTKTKPPLRHSKAQRSAW